jgi:hypothetical protein
MGCNGILCGCAGRIRQDEAGWQSMVCKQGVGVSVYLARVPRGTDRNGHVSLFVSSLASPTLCGSLHGGSANFNSLVISTRKTI